MSTPTSFFRRWPATTLASLGVLTTLIVVTTTGTRANDEERSDAEAVVVSKAVTDVPAPPVPAGAPMPEVDEGGAPEPALAESEPAAAHIHRGEEGKMGKPTSKAKAGLYAMKGPKDAAPAADADAWGGLSGSEVGEAYGVGGLGLVGTGRGGGGTGEGTIGLGTTGGSGHGYGSGYGGRARGPEPDGKYDASIRAQTLTVGTVDDNADPAGFAKAMEKLAYARDGLGVPSKFYDTVSPGPRHDPKPSALDVALVIDTTGSMGDELEYLKVEIREIATKISREHPGVAQRWGLVVYRDQGDAYVTRRVDFQGIDHFVDALGRQSAGGGGDTPEAMDAALAASEVLSWRQGPDTARMIFLVADAPSHAGSNAQKFADSVMNHRKSMTTVYSVAGSGVDEAAEVQLRFASRATGGQYIFLTDHSGVGGGHAAPKVEQFTVETLHDAMVRMIRGELGGVGTIQPSVQPSVPPTPAPVPAPVVVVHTPAPVVAAAAPPPAPSFWDEFKGKLGDHLQFAGMLALVMFAGIGVDSVIARRRRPEA